MKKFTSLLIGCSLALAGVALAQQPEEQASPKKEKPAVEKTQAPEAKPGRKAAKPEATAKQTGAMKATGVTNQPSPGKGRKATATEKSATATGTETGVSAQTSPGTTNEPAYGKGRKGRMTEKSPTSTGAETGVSSQPTASATPSGKQQAEQRKKGMKGAGAKTSPSATPVTAASASAAPSVAASASAAPSVATGQQTTGGNAAVKADPQKVQQVKQQVQQIKQQHVNFKAQPRPDKVPAVTFNQSYRIQGSDRWQGPQYEVFRSYHPERHDRGWYSSHYTRVELIGGGYYYWNNGYWYPAWGYDPGAEYYAYDAPIYVGYRAEQADRVIEDVHAEIQQVGYYRCDVYGMI